MLLPSIQGVIRRRLLVNFRVDPEVVQRILPSGLTPKLQEGRAIAGICLIRLEQVRPTLLPLPVGFSSENAAHRVAVLWRDPDGSEREGVYIPRRHTNSALVLALGGRVFPGVHQRASFDVHDNGERLRLAIRATAGDMSVSLEARSAVELPPTSVFGSVEEASEFFRGGSIGYSPALKPGRLEGLRLMAPDWRVAPLAVAHVDSSWLSDPERFPAGSVEFDCALIMRDISHHWMGEPDLYVDAERVGAGGSPPRGPRGDAG